MLQECNAQFVHKERAPVWVFLGEEGRNLGFWWRAPEGEETFRKRDPAQIYQRGVNPEVL